MFWVAEVSLGTMRVEERERETPAKQHALEHFPNAMRTLCSGKRGGRREGKKEEEREREREEREGEKKTQPNEKIDDLHPSARGLAPP